MCQTKVIKRIAVMLLAAILVLGSSLTTFAATVTQTNPNTKGIQLIGNTLLISEDHHKFFIWGKSLMIQCPGVTDVLPNNNTKLIDVQFDGNLYKGIEEVLIVKTQGKDDKICLEEGSMIVTGIMTPEQVQEVKNAIKKQPANLSELKAAFINECVELGNTKNYIIGKNAVINETGAKINPKSIEGTAELIGVDQAIQSSGSIPEEKKSEPTKEEKKVPTPTPTPKKCTHQYLVGDHNYVVCVKCGAANPECNGCLHVWDEYGYCQLCDHDCYHKYPTGIVGASCEICGYNPAPGPTPSPAPVCSHTYGYDDIDNDEVHECKGCFATFSHHYNTDGRCEDCGHVCTHGDATTGICAICGKALSTTICAHTSGYDLISETQHECRYCHEKFSHIWDDGWCIKCGQPCPSCSGNGKPGGCGNCGKDGSPTSCPDEANHSSLHQGVICQTCFDYVGTAPHHWTNKTGYCDECNAPCSWCSGVGAAGGCSNCGKDTNSCPDEANHALIHQGIPCLTCMAYVGTVPHTWVQDTELPYRHGCTCGTYEPHHWTNKTGYCDECNAPCPSCSGAGTAEGCGNCGKISGCSLAAGHSAIHRDKYCPECEYPGTASHLWIDAHDGTHACECGCCEYHEWLNGICTGCFAIHDCTSYSDGKCPECGKYCPDCGNDSDNIEAGSSCPTCGLQGTAEPCSHLFITLLDEIYHECTACHTPFEHRWHEGYCLDCEAACPTCGGNGAIGGCPNCHYE